MAELQRLQSFLSGIEIDPAIFALRPDYRALVLAISGITPTSSDEASEGMLQAAEAFARERQSSKPVTELPHIAAWREAYKAFGAKPAKYRNSLEALTRRVTVDGKGGLPRVNRLTDVYNAISVKHQIPLGGEDLDKYTGSPKLIRAIGDENFQAFSSGEPVAEHPDRGEVVWCDDVGVTCRRWNWRQGSRTALTDGSKSIVVIMDALQPLTDQMLEAAADELVDALKVRDPGLVVARRLISASS